MKKLFDGKFLFIVALSLVVLIILGVGSFYLFNNDDATFTRSGYVLNPLSPKVEKYFFEENTGYRENLSQMIEFKDVDDKDVTIFKESFLHYNDGSVSFLKNGAILDLDSIKGTEAVKFYNITNKSIVEKKNDGYVIKTDSNDINLKNFIGRISDDKYLVAGSLEAKIPGNNTNIKADYFEIVYTEEGIVNIENKDAKYQVTAEGTYIYIGNMVIDLGNKKITKNGQDVMSLTSITIDGDENIEIIPKAEDDKENDNDGNGGNEGENGNGNNDGNNQDTDGNEGGNDGTGDGQGSENTETQPDGELAISLKDAKVGSTSVNVSFDIANQGAEDRFTLKVTNLNTGRTVDIFNDVKPDQDIRVNLLSPKTKYLFTLINENDQGKYFQKIFETNDFGIKLEKNYATSDALSYKVIVDSETDITNAKLSLYKFNEETNKNEIVKTSYYDAVDGETKFIEKVFNLASLDSSIAGEHIVTFDSLDSNTIYTAVLDEFSVVSTNFKDIYNITSTDLTLKKAPSFGNMTVNKDISANGFKLALSDIVDPDNAITNYTYLIYEYGNDNDVAIPPISKSNASAIQVKIGNNDNDLKNDTNYYYKVVIEYFDNEKYVEYVTTDSINFVMGTEPYITVIPVQEKISYNTIGATIYLIDNSCLVSMPGRSKCDGESTAIVNVSKVNAITGETISVFSKTVDFAVSENEVKYDLYLEDLQPGTNYAISVRAARNDLQGDDLVEILHTDESKRTISTKTLSSFVSEWIDQESSVNHVVNVGEKLVGQDGSGTMSAEESAAAIKKVVMKLYDGNNLDELQTEQPIAVKKITNSDEFNIKENFYDKAFDITSDGTFDLDIEQLKSFNENGKLSEYYTIVFTAYYDINETNEVRISNNVTSYRISPVLLMENVEDPQIHIESISKGQSGIVSDLNNDGTVVGYKVTAAFDRTGLIENHLEPKNIYFYVYSANGERVNFYHKDDNDKLVLDNKISASLGTENYYETKIYMDYGSEYNVNDDKMARGNKYYIGYEIDLSSDKGMEKYPSNTNGSIKNNYGLYKDVISEKETPLLKMFVSKSSATSITYRYELVDPDNALYRENENDEYGFYYVINDGEARKIILNKTDASVKTFSGDIVINGLNKGDVYKLYYKKNVAKTGNFLEDVLDYYDGIDSNGRLFDGFYNANDSEYNFKFDVINNPLSDNKVIIKILASDNFMERVLGYRVKFTDSKGNNLTKELWKLSDCGNEENRCFSVDYIELKNAGMKSENNHENVIKVSVQAFYDTGLMGYDFTVGNDKEYKYMILQNNNTSTEYGKYISFSSRGQLTNWTDAIDMPKGYYTYSNANNRLTYTSLLNSAHSASISYNITSSGYVSTFGAMNPKMVELGTLTSDNDTFSFSSITPKVRINGITRLINGVVINPQLSGADIADFCEEANGQNCINTNNGDKYLYVDIWNNESDAGDANKKILPTQKVKINNANPNEALNIIIDKLDNSTTYYYQIYAYLNKNDRKVYTQLFDASFIDKYETKTYTFQTLSSTDIINPESINIEYKSNLEGNYQDKLLNTKFSLLPYSNNTSFNYDISYAFCNLDDENCGIEEEGEGSSNIFKRTVEMNDLKATFVDTQDITSFDLEYDKNYKLYIYAVFDVYNSETHTVNKKHLLLNRRNTTVNLKKLTVPEFIVGREANYIDDKYALDFSINVKDLDRVLINGEYFVKLVNGSGVAVGDLQVKGNDGNYVTVATNGNYTDYAFDASVTNKNIRITNLSENTKYTIVVSGKAYVNNYSETVAKPDRTISVEKTHTVYTTNKSGVAFGNDLLFSATEKSIVVTFLGGSNFDNVREINYTIGLWDNEHSEATFSGSYVLSESDKKFEYHTDTDDWRFVIDPEGMTNVLGQTYTVALSFNVYNEQTGLLDYYDSVTNPAFAGRAQYVKDNTK